jgi:hypothetical protein
MSIRYQRLSRVLMETFRGWKCLLLLASLLCGVVHDVHAAGDPSNQEERNTRVGQQLVTISQSAAQATSSDLVERLKKVIPDLPVIVWEGVFSATHDEPNALRQGWFIKATMYPIDSGMLEKDEEAFFGYQTAAMLFASLCQKDADAALSFLLRSEKEEPTLLHGMLCGIAHQRLIRSRVSATPEAQDGLFAGSNRLLWRRMLEAENPILRSFALTVAAPSFAGDSALTESIGGGLSNRWVSLHHIALESAANHRPPNMAGVLDAYLSGLPARPESATVKESLRAKALQSKAALSTPRPGGGS